MSIEAINEEKEKEKYLKKIIQLLHMNMDDFMHCLVHKCNYEVNVYNWSKNLYDQGISSEKAVQEINKKLLFINNHSKIFLNTP